MFIKYSFLLLIMFSLFSCQATPPLPIYENSSLTSDNSALVYIYMPKRNFVGALLNYRVTINNKYRGSLSRGKSLSARIIPGKAKIIIQGYFGNSPNQNSEFFEVDLESGSVGYYRYSNHAKNVETTVIGNNGYVNGSFGAKFIKTTVENFDNKK